MSLIHGPVVALEAVTERLRGVEGLLRDENDGGDLVTLPDGSVWLVAMLLEDFSLTSGWAKAAITRQDGS